MDTHKRSAREISEELSRLASQTNKDYLTLLHELSVYQEELTAQNEELIRAQTALEETRDRFVDLYDFAPNGYVTLDAHGVVMQINLTGASLLGRSRELIERTPLLRFVAPEHHERLFDFLRLCRAEAHQTDVVTELTVRTGDGPRDVQLLCRQHLAAEPQLYFTAMVDITDRRLLEAERDAVALEHAALASRMISIQDDERQRIARDLHDNLGQQVTALRLLLDIVNASPIDPAVRDRVQQAQSVVEALDRQLDFMTGELRPVALDLGAISAIDQFVHGWSKTFGVPAEFRCIGVEDVRLDAAVETHLYRVVQEALNNVAKHAAAHHVSVECARHDNSLVLTIRDDGRGFDLSGRARARADERSHGLGLVGMRERAQIINGKINVSSTVGQGTTITLEVPWRTTAASERRTGPK